MLFEAQIPERKYISLGGACLPHYRLNDLNALAGLAHGFAAAARAVTRRFCPRLHNRVLRRLIGAWRGVITSPQPDGPYLLVGRRLFSLLSSEGVISLPQAHSKPRSAI